MSKMEGLVGYELNDQLPLPIETPASYPPLVNGWLNTPRLSMADSVGMLRTLSMSGNLGMPSLAVPLEDWTQRRPSGRIYDEEETEDLQSWMMTTGVPQPV